MFEQLKEKAAGVEEQRQHVHEWSERTLTQALVLIVFYGVLTISVIGILVLGAAWALAKQQG